MHRWTTFRWSCGLPVRKSQVQDWGVTRRRTLARWWRRQEWQVFSKQEKKKRLKRSTPVTVLAAQQPSRMEQILLTLQLDSASLLSLKCLPRLPWPPVWSPKMFKCLQRKLKIIAICSRSCKSFKAATIRNTPFVHYCNFLQILLIHRVFAKGFCDSWWNCPIIWNYHLFLNTAVLKSCFFKCDIPRVLLHFLEILLK